MSIESITGDEFLELTLDDHQEALELYAEAVAKLSQVLPAASVGSPDHNSALDRMCRLLTLRKVHQVRVQEMEEEAQEPASLPASEQYAHNERQPALA